MSISMNKSPAFQFYPNDWLSSPSIMMMTPAEEGAYIRLLSICWMNNGLPDDDEQLAQLSRLGNDWEKSKKKILSCFVKRRTKLVNKRQEKERKKQKLWTLKSRQGGISSGKSRKTKGLQQEEPLKGGCEMVDDCLQPNGNTSSSTPTPISTPTPSTINWVCNNKENSHKPLVLGLRITEFIEESFKPFNAREQTTFRNISVHLAEYADEKYSDSPMRFLLELKEWVKSSKLPNIKRPKSMFVAICKKKTGFQSQKKIL